MVAQTALFVSSMAALEKLKAEKPEEYDSGTPSFLLIEIDVMLYIASYHSYYDISFYAISNHSYPLFP